MMMMIRARVNWTAWKSLSLCHDMLEYNMRVANVVLCIGANIVRVATAGQNLIVFNISSSKKLCSLRNTYNNLPFVNVEVLLTGS